MEGGISCGGLKEEMEWWCWSNSEVGAVIKGGRSKQGK